MAKTWECKIGEADAAKLPPGADAPMRFAVETAYQNLTGEPSKFLFSGWGAELTEPERAVVEDRLPNVMPEDERRDELARIIETVAKDGLPDPRDLDVACDAIEELFKN